MTHYFRHDLRETFKKWHRENEKISLESIKNENKKVVKHTIPPAEFVFITPIAFLR